MCFLQSLISTILDSSFQTWILKFAMNENGTPLQEKVNTDESDPLCHL